MVSEGHSNASEPLAASLGPTLAPAPAHLQDMIRTSAAYHTGCKDSDQGIMQRQCLSSLGVSETHNRVMHRTLLDAFTHNLFTQDFKTFQLIE